MFSQAGPHFPKNKSKTSIVGREKKNETFKKEYLRVPLSWCPTTWWGSLEVKPLLVRTILGPYPTHKDSFGADKDSSKDLPVS